MPIMRVFAWCGITVELSWVGRSSLILFSRLLMLVLLQYLFSNGTSLAHASRLRCADFPIAFEYEDFGEIKCVSETARAAITFLETLGLETTEVITIRLVDNFPFHQTDNLIGSYNPTSREIDLLTYSKTIELSQRNNSILSIDLSEDIWCSYVAHELAHAISIQYINPEVENHTAAEYISAVTQLMVLTPESREKFLKTYQNIEAYKSMSEISVLYFWFAPNEFAVKCYLHFISLDKPKVFIERLVTKEDGFWEGH